MPCRNRFRRLKQEAAVRCHLGGNLGLGRGVFGFGGF
jgi:hypothetical protein